ncbi:hypothetical protein ACFPZ0_02070 [Streptomonospora nanhaiensis]|uniref:Chaplin domain-containing protein n=1 Tax=Streptomonospora nanhaiensis TaxID=1323731 RepID=A0A853BNR7_9ACTN|nr:hypothetical protein [Streptomonospora nanhaiensis]MBV2361827.1 hypothetical protein [Streptomonospora nanhaiensis]MBX9388350.1 hypothetical protein [Streptomonospora nanhaiensis]NYI96355.1 hypothetical protein [Streptomonospora nanhaiensis]
MLRKVTAAGLLAGAALGALLLAGPAQAEDRGADQQFNQNLQVLPIQLCNTNVAVLGANVPVLSPQTTGDCVNGPSLTNLNSRDAYNAIPEPRGDGR